MAKPGTKTKLIFTRLTPGDHAALTDFAAKEGMAVSEVLRRLAREVVGNGPTFDGDLGKRISELTKQMRAAGRNLNQAVAALNAGARPGDEVLAQTFRLIRNAIIAQESEYVSLCEGASAKAQAAVRNKSP